MAALKGEVRSTIGPEMLLAAISQLLVFPEQVFLMMMLPPASTSMPRSAPMQVLPSMRLLELVAWMFAPSPAPLPLLEHALPRTTQENEHKMPSRVLERTVQSATVVPVAALIPLAMLEDAEQLIIVQPVPVLKPF